MDRHDSIQYITTRVTGAALYEQMAEEAAELAHAALKLSRIARGENPTPTTLCEAMEHLVEELSDLALILEVAGQQPDPEQMDKKLARWVARLKC